MRKKRMVRSLGLACWFGRTLHLLSSRKASDILSYANGLCKRDETCSRRRGGGLLGVISLMEFKSNHHHGARIYTRVCPKGYQCNIFRFVELCLIEASGDQGATSCNRQKSSPKLQMIHFGSLGICQCLLRVFEKIPLQTRKIISFEKCHRGSGIRRSIQLLTTAFSLNYLDSGFLVYTNFHWHIICLFFVIVL